MKSLERDEPTLAALMIFQVVILLVHPNWPLWLVLVPLWLVCLGLAALGLLWMLATATLYRPLRNIKAHAKRRGIAHAGYVKHTAFGYKGYCVCGYKTSYYKSRAFAIMLIDEHVDQELEILETAKWSHAQTYKVAPAAVKDSGMITG